MRFASTPEQFAAGVRFKMPKPPNHTAPICKEFKQGVWWLTIGPYLLRRMTEKEILSHTTQDKDHGQQAKDQVGE